MTGLTATRPPASHGPGWFPGLVRAEWIKFRATRSSYLSLLATVVVALGVGTLIAESLVARWPHLTPQDRAGVDPLQLSIRGFQIAQLIIGALGVLIISSEYSTGLIRVTLSAAPQRRAVLLAKTAVIGTVALLVAEAASFVTFFTTQAVFHSVGRGLSLAAPGALRAVSALGLYLAVVALLGLALGALIRHTAGAISALFVVVFLIPNVVSALPSPWDSRIGKWLPADLVTQLLGQHANPALLSRVASLIVLLAYPVVFLAAAAWRLSRSDA